MDLGYRGVDADNPGVRLMHRGRIKSMSLIEKKRLKRRQAVEPVIGQVKRRPSDDPLSPDRESGRQAKVLMASGG